MTESSHAVMAEECLDLVHLTMSKEAKTLAEQAGRQARKEDLPESAIPFKNRELVKAWFKGFNDKQTSDKGEGHE